MHAIEKKSYGFKLTFGDFINKTEMEKWRAESEQALRGRNGKMSVFIDMRSLKPLPADAQAVMVKGQQLYKQAGMERSVVILNDAVTTMQFKRLAKESGISAWERYIDAFATPNWEQAGVNWLVNATDPD